MTELKSINREGVHARVNAHRANEQRANEYLEATSERKSLRTLDRAYWFALGAIFMIAIRTALGLGGAL